MNNQKVTTYLKYAIWVVLGLIVLIPIYVDSDFFFPYIFSKSLAFRVLVEVLLLLWLGYLWSDKEKKVKIDWLTVVFFVMLVFMYISAIFGIDFYRSFWSIMERGEGVLLWTHMFVFFVVLRNFIAYEKGKLLFLDAFLVGALVVAVIGLLQFIGVDFINKSGVTDGRIQSTIGNAAYVAGYMLFSFFFAAYLFVKRNNIWLKVYYVVAAVLSLFIMFNTATRGAFLAFLAAIFLFIIYNVFRASNKKVKISFSILILLFVVLVGLVFLVKDTQFVKDNDTLSRMTSISLTERTAQTRLMAWEAAWQGFKARPVIGYGAENYYKVFNENFNPKIYAHAGSRVWFDRAHNIFLEHLINGGIIELILYISWLALPTWALLKKSIFRKNKENWDKQILLLAIVGFVVQGMVVFEAMVTYIPLLIVLAFVAERYLKPIKTWNHREIVLGIGIVYLVAMFPIMYFVNIREAKANQLLIEALRMQQVNIDDSFNTYVESIEVGSTGTNEFYRRIAEFVDSLVVNQAVIPYQALTYVEKVDEYLEGRVESHPWDTSNYLLYMRHLNYTYPLDPNRLYKVEELGPAALETSPTRPHIYYEIGYADLYIYQMKRSQGDEQAMAEYQQKVVDNFQKAIDLNPEVEESYINMIMSLLASDQGDKVESYLMIMDGHNINYKNEESLLRMANSAVHSGYFDWSAYFYEELTKINSQDPEYFISLALSYANIDEIAKAIEIAQKVMQFGQPYDQQAQQFIDSINNGTFQKQQ